MIVCTFIVRSVEKRQMLIQTLNNFTEQVNLPPGESRLEVTTEDITVQVNH